MPKGRANKRYSEEFKQKVVEDMRDNGLSYHESKRKYEIKAQMLFKSRNLFILKKHWTQSLKMSSDTANMTTKTSKPGIVATDIR